MKINLSIVASLFWLNCHAQSGLLNLIIETDTILFGSELSVYLDSKDSLIAFNNGASLIKDDSIEFSSINKILVVYYSDSLEFFVEDDFDRDSTRYESGEDAYGLSSLDHIVPTFKAAYQSNRNMYFIISNYDERKDQLKNLPDNMRKFIEKQIEQDQGKQSLILRYHIGEIKRFKLKVSGK